ncbi:hypothetical protein CGRA01v4_14837 [Colletotrichum graminicola]|nr:hypothetical protein CGRA01v4_14837 [Colletotrichum graminicola]
MRISTLAVTVVSVVALSSTNKAVAADGKAGKPGRQAGIQRVSASIKVGHDARSPQDSDGFVSYDYGYSYPAPPPPTTYTKLSSSSTWTSLASSSNVSYTELSSVASVTGTSGVSGSASFGSIVSASATVTLRDSVFTFLPTSAIATRSASTAISESFSYTTSFTTGPFTSSLDDITGTLASVTDTDVPYTPSPGLSDSTIWSHSTTSISSMIPSFTLSGSTAIVSSTMTFSKPDSASTSNSATLTQPVEAPWPTWSSTMLTAPIQSTQTASGTFSGFKCFKHTASVHELINHGAVFTKRDNICNDDIGIRTCHLISDQNIELAMVNVKHNYQCHIERIFFNHPRNRRHNVLARSKLNQLQPDGDQNLEPHYGNRFFLAKYFVSNLLAEYWKYNQYTRFSRNIRSLNVDFHHLSEAPTVTGSSSSAVNTSSGAVAYPTSTVTSLIGRPAPPIFSSASPTAPWNATLITTSTSNTLRSLTGSTVVVTSTWNNTRNPSLTSTSVAWPPSPQLPNSTWTTSTNATWTVTSHGSDPATSVRVSTVTRSSASLPPWPVSNSTTLTWATGTISIPLSTSTVASGAHSSISSSNLPPWATLNSTVASITGTVSIPVLNSSTVTATVFSSSLVASFPWNNATFSHPLTGTLTVSLITVSGGATITLWPPNATWTSQVNTTVRPPSSTNSTVLPTTEIGTSSLTSTGPPLTLVPPLPTGNSTLISGPTWVRTSSILLSTGVTTVSTDMTVTSTDSPPLPTANSTSSLVATRPATVTVSGSVITLISTLTGVPATLTGSVTGTPISPTLPPYPTTNSTVLSGPTAGGTEVSNTASGTLFQTSEPAETSSGSIVTPPPPFPTGNNTVIPGQTGNVTITWISGTISGPLMSTLISTRANSSVAEIVTSVSSSGISGSASSSPFSSPPFLNSTPISGAVSTTHLTWSISGTAFSSLSILPVPTPPPSNSSVAAQPSSVTTLLSTSLRTSISTAIFSSSSNSSRTSPFASITVSGEPAITNSRSFPAGTSAPCHTVTVTNGTVTQVVTRSVLVTTATASANPTVAYPPLSTNTTVALSRTLCTSKWQNLTSTTSAAGFKSTWTSLVLTNRTSSSLDRATTFITSTTTRSGDPGGGDDGFPSESTFVFGTPTTTITDAPLPSNTAYPWGGLGPIFRPHEKAEPKTGGAYLPKLKDGKAHAA